MTSDPLVGYDGLEGPRAYQQLGEVYRAVRLYVNFFQPSMKLVSKRREGAKVNRQYDPAQTPWQRRLASGHLTEAAREQLSTFYPSLDPVRLLGQLERLQDALWEHARVKALPTERTALPVRPPEPQIFQHATAREVPPERRETETTAAPVTAEALEPKVKRKYRNSGQPRAPHTWRTRADPFAAVWEEVEEWLATEPERTAKSLFQQLQARYPGGFPAGQLRTLQRRVKVWRREAILTFDAGWLAEERRVGAVLPGPLRAVPAAPNSARTTGHGASEEFLVSTTRAV